MVRIEAGEHAVGETRVVDALEAVHRAALAFDVDDEDIAMAIGVDRRMAAHRFADLNLGGGVLRWVVVRRTGVIKVPMPSVTAKAARVRVRTR